MRTTLHVVRLQHYKKLGSRPSITATDNNTAHNHRFFIKDTTTSKYFLVDTGAALSIIPRSMTKHARASTHQHLYAANDTKIATYGTIRLNINFNLRRVFTWNFMVADIQTPILGADFLIHFKLVINLSKAELIDSTTQLSSKGILTNQPYNRLSTIKPNDEFHQLVSQYIGTTDINNYKLPLHSTVQHTIETTCQPIREPPRRYSGEKLKTIREEFDNLLHQGIIRPSNSPWASPIHLVKKKTGGWRPCGDYRKLNAATQPDRYPIPHIDDIQEKLHNSKIFSKIDLQQAYHNVPMRKEDIPKTAVSTPFGLFEFVVMPFGLRNATQTFQRYMNQIFHQLDFVFVYIDDILIFSENKDQHIKHIKTVLKKIAENNLTINLSKCTFGTNKVDFLGFNISSDGISPPRERIEAIINYPQPQTILQLRRYLGMITFYRKFIPHAADILAPLNSYLKASTKNDKRPVPWTVQTEEAFAKSKSILANAVLLNFIALNAPLRLTTDASNVAVGAHLDQFSKGIWSPLAFFSSKLNSSQLNYSTYDRELLAIYLAIKHFSHILHGRNFEIVTDHKPLIYIFTQKSDNLSPRRQRHIAYISEFTTKISHLQGEENTVADALSRVEVIELPTLISNEELQQAQQQDLELEQLLQNTTSLKLKKINIPPNSEVYVDASARKICPYVPEPLRKTVFHMIHDLSHPGNRSTLKQIRGKYVWPAINKDVRKWTRECTACQIAKVSRHNHLPPQHFELPTNRFIHIHIDIITMPLHKGYRFCLTIIDRFTRWPAAIPMKDMRAETIIRKLYKHWICHFGTPKTITTDQGTQFESSLFTAFSRIIMAERIRTTPFHPESNGMIERWHRSLKQALMCNPDIPWTELLPTALLGLRTCYKNDLKCSAAEMVYGATLNLPGEFLHDSDSPTDPHEHIAKLQQQIRRIKPRPAAHHSNTKKFFTCKGLDTCARVFVRIDRPRKPLEPPYEGPFLVKKRIDDRTFIINKNGKEQAISTSRLKPEFSDNNNFSATSPDLQLTTSAVATQAKTTPSTTPQQQKANKKVRFKLP